MKQFKIFPIILTAFLILTILPVSAVFRQCPDCGCSNLETIPENIADDCSEPSYSAGSKCADCGKIIEAPVELPLFEHSYGTIDYKAPTCTEEGNFSYKGCVICGKPENGSKSDYIIPASSHTSSEIYLAPTCLSEGMKYSVCSVCNTVLSEKKSIKPLAHSEIIIPSVNPTCTQDGYTEGSVCKVCNTIVKNPDAIKSTGHKEIITKEGTPGTCLTDGLTEEISCETCGLVLSAQSVITAKGHNIVIVDKKDATCTEDGHRIYKYCTLCDYTTLYGDGKTYTNVIKATGHTPEECDNLTPTCTEDGFSDRVVCSVCGEELQKNVISAVGHKFKTVEGTAPTCTKDGKTEKTYCTLCGYEEKAQETIKATGHNIVTDKEVPAICLSTGLTEGSHCSICNTVIVPQQSIAAKGHSLIFSDDILPTCTTPGYKNAARCENCDYVTGTEIPAKNHIEITDEAVAATCNKTGLTEGSHCLVCKEIFVAQKVTEKTNHTPDKRSFTVITDTNDVAFIVYKCKVCNEECEKVSFKATSTDATITDADTDDFDISVLSPDSTASAVTDETDNIIVIDKDGNVVDKDTTLSTGMYVIINGDTISTIAVPGDVDCDGKITAADARLALRRAVGLERFDENSAIFKAADIDGDGKVLASDARIILRIAVSLDSADNYISTKKIK